MTLVRPFTLNFTEPMVFLLNLYIALIYGLLYIWFESFPIVFIEIHGFTLGEQGLAYLGIFIGAVLVIPPFYFYLWKVQEKQFNENGEIQPEKRLPPAFVGAFCVPICTFERISTHGPALLVSCSDLWYRSILVWLVRTFRRSLDHAHYRLRLVQRWRDTSFQLCHELPGRRLSRLCG